MIRSIIAVIVGPVVAVVLIQVIEMISVLIYPLPQGLDWKDTEAMKIYVAGLPAGAFLMVLFGWFVGTFCGTALAVRIARRAPAVHATIICGLFLLIGLVNLLSLPHPTWFWYATFVTFPLAAFAGTVVSRIRATPFAA